jgi:glutathione S-transferase
MLKIWGRLSSINVRKVVLTALVPVIEDDQVQLWESNVIVRYLCARYAPDLLYPLALPQRFEAERWMDWQQTTLNPAGRNAFMQWIRTPAERRDEPLIAQSVAATEPLMELLDHHLADKAFVVGDRITMADLPLACEVHRWIKLPKPRTVRPHLDRWYEAMCARPSSRGVLDLELA